MLFHNDITSAPVHPHLFKHLSCKQHKQVDIKCSKSTASKDSSPPWLYFRGTSCLRSMGLQLISSTVRCLGIFKSHSASFASPGEQTPKESAQCPFRQTLNMAFLLSADQHSSYRVNVKLSFPFTDIPTWKGVALSRQLPPHSPAQSDSLPSKPSLALYRIERSYQSTRPKT